MKPHYIFMSTEQARQRHRQLLLRTSKYHVGGEQSSSQVPGEWLECQGRVTQHHTHTQTHTLSMQSRDAVKQTRLQTPSGQDEKQLFWEASQTAWWHKTWQETPNELSHWSITADISWRRSLFPELCKKKMEGFVLILYEDSLKKKELII